MGTKKLSETILNIVLVIAGLALWISAQSIEVGAAMGKGGDFMPKLCSGIWLAIGVLMLVTGWMAKDDGERKSFHVKGFFATLLLLFVYILLLKPVGFVITSIVYMFVQMLLFVPKELMTKKRLILFGMISVILPIAVNLLFVNVFSLILPAGILS